MFLTRHDNSVIPVLLEGFNLLPMSWNTKWSIVPIIQTPEKIQIKYWLNISQQNLYIIHVMSGDDVIHSSIAKSPPHDLSLITCLGTIKYWYLWK